MERIPHRNSESGAGAGGLNCRWVVQRGEELGDNDLAAPGGACGGCAGSGAVLGRVCSSPPGCELQPSRPRMTCQPEEMPSQGKGCS